MRHRSRVLAAVGLLVVVVAGYLVGQAWLPVARRGGSLPAVPADRAATNPQTTSVAAAPNAVVEDAQSARGAVSAAATYLRVLDGPGPAGRQIRGLQAVTVAPFTGRVNHLVPAIAALRRRLSRGGPSLVEGWLLGWRVTSATLDHARVQIWTMGVVAAPAAGISPEWSTTTCTVRWTHGSWRVTDARTTAGPTPPSPRANGAQVAAFVNAASRFTVFDDAS